jgi:hypothetical protein
VSEILGFVPPSCKPSTIIISIDAKCVGYERCITAATHFFGMPLLSAPAKSAKVRNAAMSVNAQFLKPHVCEAVCWFAVRHSFRITDYLELGALSLLFRCLSGWVFTCRRDIRFLPTEGAHVVLAEYGAH